MEARDTHSFLHMLGVRGSGTSLELKECPAGTWGCGSYLLRARLDLGQQLSKGPQGRALTQSIPGEGTKRTQQNCPRLHKASPCTQGCFFLHPHTRYSQILFLSPSDIQPAGTCAHVHAHTHTHTPGSASREQEAGLCPGLRAGPAGRRMCPRGERGSCWDCVTSHAPCSLPAPLLSRS